MMKKIIVFLFLIPVPLICAGNLTTGELVYFEGELSVQSGNDLITEDDIEIGQIIEEYDLVSTGSDGYAEILVNSSVSEKIILKLEPGSNLYFTLDKKSGGDKFSIKMLSGSIFAKVNKLIGNGEMDISSKSAVMGIRGTELYITTAPDGSLLVTCPEGNVSCKSGGAEVYAGNGNAAEMLYGRPAKTISVSDDIAERYRKEWAAERERIFRSMSFSIIKPSAIQYEELYNDFEKNYKELKKFKKIISKYLEKDKTVTASEAVKDKISISPSVLRMRGIFFRFEQQFYRIKELKKYYDEDPVKGKVRKKYTIADFMKDYSKNYNDVEKELLFARAAFKAFLIMSSSGPGQSSLVDEIFSGNPLLE